MKNDGEKVSKRNSGEQKLKNWSSEDKRRAEQKTPTSTGEDQRKTQKFTNQCSQIIKNIAINVRCAPFSLSHYDILFEPLWAWMDNETIEENHGHWSNEFRLSPLTCFFPVFFYPLVPIFLRCALFSFSHSIIPFELFSADWNFLPLLFNFYSISEYFMWFSYGLSYQISKLPVLSSNFDFLLCNF